MPWTETPVHVLDLEGHKRYGVVEFGLVTVLRGEISHCQTATCRPTGPIPEEDSRLHGLRSADLASAPAFGSLWEVFIGLRREGPFAAHHAAFEDGLVRHIWAYPSFVPDFSLPSRQVASWGPWIDTCRLSQTLHPERGSHRLGDLVAAHGLEGDLKAQAKSFCPPGRDRFHCALYDALAAALLLLRLTAGSDPRPTIPQLIRWSNPMRSGADQTELSWSAE